MVDMKTDTKSHQQAEQKPDKPVNPRDAIREKRQRRMRLIAGDKPATIKVYAANEDMLAVLRHPGRGIRFRDKIDQPVEWPNDRFTARRIRDGSVRTDGPGSGDAPKPDESLNAREQSAARSAQSKQQEKQEEHPKNGSKQAPKPQPQPTQPPSA